MNNKSNGNSKRSACLALALAAMAIVCFGCHPPTPMAKVQGQVVRLDSFNPTAGVPGTTVTLTGMNFSPVTTNNIVYFGAAQAIVTSASSASLTVTEPAGATYAPITETVNGLTACSDKFFLPSFPSAGIFTNASLGSPIVLDTIHDPGPILVADLDGDGKPDVVVASGAAGAIEIYRNISANGELNAASFAPPVILPLGGGQGETVVAADLTGDGKLDLVCLNQNNNTLMLLKNLCVPGSITANSFAPPVCFPVGNTPQGVAVQDLDGDGKPEIVVANRGDSTLGVFHNLSTPGIITTNSFAPMIAFATGANPQNVAIADIDGDGKPDLVSVGGNFQGDTPSLSVLRNLGTTGNIAFAGHVDFAGPQCTYCLAIGDIDGDGKPDVVIGSQPGGQAVSIYRNTSSPGSITSSSFAPPVNFDAGAWVNGVALGDMNGDGKPDVVVSCQSPSQMEVFLNQSAPGVIADNSLAAPLVFDSGDNPNGIAVGYLNGDGRPDIVFANDYSANMSIYLDLDKK